ncbi:MAG: heptosyltransferase [Rickettsiales bacterium]|nr:heptosyltransferase [Rickettsiales bacterium]
MQILIIQTAFIGDVVLATPLAEKLHQYFPQAAIDFCVRKGNEGLFDQHPFVRKVHLLDKSRKTIGLYQLIKEFRSIKYDLIINLHRFLSSGLLTVLSGADQTIGFRKNPVSFFYSEQYSHDFDGTHEVERNLRLIQGITDKETQRPKLYVEHLSTSIKERFGEEYVVIAPGSVWETKKLPLSKWVELIKEKLVDKKIFLIGGKGDRSDCEIIVNQTLGCQVQNVAGELKLLESVTLIRGASMNYVNDSAPLHFASAVNAPVTAVFCSTIPRFGFAPLSDKSFIAESSEHLSCRPCAIHGRKKCPEGHFRCGNTVIL